MKAQLLIDKDEFNKHIDEVSRNAATVSQWNTIRMLHQILTTKEDPVKFGETVSEADKAMWNDLSIKLRSEPVLKKRKPVKVE